MAFVRVKRRLQDDPIDALLLTCKKAKTDGSEQAALFKFAATIKTQEEDLRTYAKKAALSSGVSAIKQRDLATIREKLRVENQSSSKNNRLKVVNCRRSIDPNVNVDPEDLDNAESKVVPDEKPLTIVDIEVTPSPEKLEKNPSESEPVLTNEQFVYDLYYAAIPDVDDLMMDKILSAHAVEEQLFEGFLEGDDMSEVADDEDDSNDENNWRNDYPDEDEFPGEDSDDDLPFLMGAMEIKGAEDESDLSSDEYDEALVYGEDVNPADIYNYGHGYANYKAKVARSLSTSTSSLSDVYSDCD